jgi:hypothetical protein
VKFNQAGQRVSLFAQGTKIDKLVVRPMDIGRSTATQQPQKASNKRRYASVNPIFASMAQSSEVDLTPATLAGQRSQLAIAIHHHSGANRLQHRNIIERV